MSRFDLDNLWKDVYTKDELEEMAVAINERYFPKRLERPTPFDAYLFLDLLGFDYEWDLLSPGLQISAMTFFSDGGWYIWDKPSYFPGDKPHLKTFKKGTVVVNSTFLSSKGLRKSEAFAVTHEGCHIIKDKRYFEAHPREISAVFKLNDSKRKYWNGSAPTVELIERQNDYLTAAVIMPKEQIKAAFFKSMRYKNIPDEPIGFKLFMKKHIATLAKAYDLNFNVILYRLQEIGVLADCEKEDGEK